MQLDRGKTCCFSGHRPDKLPGGYAGGVAAAPLRTALVKAIGRAVEDGYDTFLCGMALGADTWAAEEVLRLRDAGAPIRLIGALPCPEQDSRWPAASRRRYRELTARLDEVYTACETYTPYCMNLRNRWMADHASRLIAVFNGSPGGTKNTVEYAEGLGLDLVILAPQDYRLSRGVFTL